MTNRASRLAAAASAPAASAATAPAAVPSSDTPVIDAAAAAIVAELGTSAPADAPTGAHAAAAPTSAPADENRAQPQSIDVRVLRAIGDLQPNDVTTLDVETLLAAIEDGWADADPAAVEYARSLRA